MFTKITFKTNKNNGNMEHDSLELEYVMSPEFESIEEAFEEVKETAYRLLKIDEETRGMDRTGRATTKRPNRKA